jgi:hypothetical protein
VIEDPAAIRRFAGWALVAGLSLAAATAILALLVGDFGDTSLRVILTSVGFAFSSSAAASGARLRLRSDERMRLLGTGTLGVSVAAFVLLLLGLWTNQDDWGSEGVWRAFGCAGVLGLAGSHACLVLGASRRSDSDAVRSLTTASIVLGALDALGAILAITGLTSDVEEAWARLFGAGLVLLVLTSVLPPILRRMQTRVPAPQAPGTNPSRDEALDFLASEVVQIADRIDVLNRDPGLRAPEIRAEVERLRNLAKAFQN